MEEKARAKAFKEFNKRESEEEIREMQANGTHSCKYCLNVYRNPPAGCGFCDRLCSTNQATLKVAIFDRDAHQWVYRTWEKCDEYDPKMTCDTCKHLIIASKTSVIGDQQIVYENTKNCEVGETLWKKECPKWREKE